MDLDEAQREIEELRADLVWAIRHKAHINTDGFADWYRAEFGELDCTEDAARSAIREARTKENPDD